MNEIVSLYPMCLVGNSHELSGRAAGKAEDESNKELCE